MAPQTLSNNIPALTGIRALAALLVLSLHAHQNVPTNVTAYLPFIDHGYLGVDFFFILSGFIITHVYLDNFRRIADGALRIFFWHRFVRLYPVHIATLLMMIVMVVVSRVTGRTISADNFNWSDLIWQLTLTHAWGFGGSASWNVPSWSISAEWFAYLFFPWTALVLHRIGRAAIAYLLSAAALVLMAVLFFASGLGIDVWTGGPALVRVLAEFICGAALCRAMALGTTSDERRWNGDVVAAVSLIAFAVAASFSVSDYILVGLLALTVMGSAAAGGFMKRFLGGALMVWLGEISYSIYMVHFPVLIVLRRIYEAMGYAQWSPSLQMAAYVATFAIVIAAAALLYYVIEHPTRTRLRNAFGVLSQQPASKSVA